jgi:hypothetical protein
MTSNNADDLQAQVDILQGQVDDMRAKMALDRHNADADRLNACERAANPYFAADLEDPKAYNGTDLRRTVPRSFFYEVECATAFVGAYRPTAGAKECVDLVTVSFGDTMYNLVEVDDYVERFGWCGIRRDRRPAYMMCTDPAPDVDPETATYWPVRRAGDGRLTADPNMKITPEYRAVRKHEGRA